MADKMQRGEIDRNGKSIQKQTDDANAAKLAKAMAVQAEEAKRNHDAYLAQKKAEADAAKVDVVPVPAEPAKPVVQYPLPKLTVKPSPVITPPPASDRALMERQKLALAALARAQAAERAMNAASVHEDSENEDAADSVIQPIYVQDTSAADEAAWQARQIADELRRLRISQEAAMHAADVSADERRKRYGR